LVAVGAAATVIGGATIAFAAEVVVESPHLTREHRTTISKAGIEVLAEIQTARTSIADRNVGMARRHAARAQSLVEQARWGSPTARLGDRLEAAMHTLQHRDLGSADTNLRAAQDRVRIVIAHAAVDVEAGELVVKGGK
jgi:hypothetical protein